MIFVSKATTSPVDPTITDHNQWTKCKPFRLQSTKAPPNYTKRI